MLSVMYVYSVMLECKFEYFPSILSLIEISFDIVVSYNRNNKETYREYFLIRYQFGSINNFQFQGRTRTIGIS